ncbi:SHQ1 protein-domain-containing protein [Spinellus fusiger]|nr:SHQ1 protein-domain-containing protein [Spinellus fusiger]
MITPSFSVDQDDASVIIIIKTPYVRAQDVDLHVAGSEFRFFLRPYFLRLHLPGNVIEDDDSKAVYDPSSGQFTVRITKETKGEHFLDLDLLTKLLARRGEVTTTATPTSLGETLIGSTSSVTMQSTEPFKKKPLIEVIGGDDSMENELDGSDTDQQAQEKEELQKAIDFNWELPQELPSDDLVIHSVYGFNNLYSGYFTHVQETENEIISISHPEKSSVESRRQDRCEQEELKFDEDYYAMDYINNEEIQEKINYKTIWAKELRKIQKEAKKQEDPTVDVIAPALIQELESNIEKDIDIKMKSLSMDNTYTPLKFTAKEETLMRSLPNKKYLLSNEKVVYLGLVDLLFAYSYNHRITDGENTVESVWCIGKISPTLSCLEQFTTLVEVTTASFRRVLCHPLYRHFALCEKTLQDVYILFRLGKRAVLKVLLEMKDLFDHHDVYYVYSKIWIDDYCVWIQHASDHVLRTLAHELHHFKVERNSLGWELNELEELAKEMQNAEGNQEMQNTDEVQEMEIV